MDGEEESVEEDQEDQESSYVTPVKAQVESIVKTPIKDLASMHETRQRTHH
jgi:hypothetical protein